MKVGHVFITLALAACGVAAISDRYGNQYGDWYNPGDGYRWQLDFCQRDVETRNIALADRKLVMRCCMYAHGVPIGDAQDCRA
jgi:hypothetical protein